ncbi:hypothetical protein H9L39_19738 [Fusarium oxysporum f. sp. albedinis]|nr:hypothetical protein H9L39_19738 [Fusarium oxysporum f. sp. albedinis]
MLRGPCHFWGPETAKERKEAEVAIKAMNEALEPVMKELWELENGIRRLGLRNLSGKKPEWKWKKETSKLTRGLKGGIDWWRYQQTILPKNCFLLQRNVKSKDLIPLCRRIKPPHINTTPSSGYMTFMVLSDFFGVEIALI